MSQVPPIVDPLRMKAGRQMDVLIHVRFMGLWLPPCADQTPPYDLGRLVVPWYSAIMNDAWLVVGKLRELGFLVTVKDMPDGFPYVAGNDAAVDAKLWVRSLCELYYVRRFDPGEKTRLSRKFWHAPTAMGDTPAEAICRAALCELELEERFGLAEQR